MVKFNKKVVSRIIMVGIVSLFVWYFLTNLKDFSLLLTINPLFVVLLLLLSVLAIISNGIFMKWSIFLFGKYIGVGESIRVSLISSAGNFFAPAGSGLGFRAIYLKRKHGLSYSDYLSVLFCNYIMVFFVNSLVGLLSLFILRDHVSSGFWVLAIFFTALFVTSIGAFLVRPKWDSSGRYYKQKWVRGLLETLKRISQGWTLILSNKRIATGLIGLVAFNAGMMILGSYFIMSSLGLNLSLGGLMLYAVLGSLSIFINITPGNLGVKEAVYVGFSVIIGLTTAQILSMALIDRVVTFVVLFVLWLIYGKNLLSSATKKYIDLDKDKA
ncbi:MAG TPA: lysylphosphatidylglycerol synthase transmembrane domain-containing protein [Candidatus Saccharibacteria bacterium]|nr:lysylphosphatidylglycerol synthase transmembrane domain-containing protein [Candidatus Saccharibacteria bacterium]